MRMFASEIVVVICLWANFTAASPSWRGFVVVRLVRWTTWLRTDRNSVIVEIWSRFFVYTALSTSFRLICKWSNGWLLSAWSWLTRSSLDIVQVVGCNDCIRHRWCLLLILFNRHLLNHKLVFLDLVASILFNHDVCCFLDVSNFRRSGSLQVHRILRVVAQLREITIVNHRVVFAALDACQTRAWSIVLPGPFLLDRW